MPARKILYSVELNQEDLSYKQIQLSVAKDAKTSKFNLKQIKSDDIINNPMNISLYANSVAYKVGENLFAFHTTYSLLSVLNSLNSKSLYLEIFKDGDFKSKSELKNFIKEIYGDNVLLFDFRNSDEKNFNNLILPLLNKVYSDIYYKSTNGSNMRMVLGKF